MALIWFTSAFIGAAVAQNTITGLPSQTATPTTATYSYGNVGLSAVSYSYTYTVTTPTTYWQAPTFPTAAPLPPCTTAVCPSHDKQSCVDADGVRYGILCATLFSGTVITNSGKFLAKQKRSYTGTFEGCTGFCDAFNATDCTGVSFQDGYCLLYDTITGSFPNPQGGFAAIRVSKLNGE